MGKWTERKRPITVTRGLPYRIGEPVTWKNLKRLAREVDHMWHRGKGHGMLVQQYTSLYNRVYRVRS